MNNAVRYTTVELSELEGRIAKAAERALALELEAFEVLVGLVQAQSEAIALAAQSLAQLDTQSALAQSMMYSGVICVQRLITRPHSPHYRAGAIR